MSWKPGDDPRYEPAVRELVEWVNRLVLQRPVGSQLHNLLEDWKTGKLIRPRTSAGEDFDAHTARLLSPKFQVFLIEHDWSSAFDDVEGFAPDPDGPTYDFRTPYPDCCFELFLSGKRVCFLVRFDGQNYSIAAFVRLKEGWLQPPLKWPVFRPLASVLDLQFRAIGIALEAQVAVSEVVRASHKLNRSQERRGRQPTNDYHIVRLPPRARPQPLEDTAGERRRTRLHFRRGHWRHFDDHKTWIKWTLVGDPDLGFIEKHYSL